MLSYSCCFVSWQGTLRDLFTIEPDTAEPQLTVTKTAPVEEIETEEESLEEPEAASTADSTEANTSKTTNGKMSQNLLEQVKKDMIWIIVVFSYWLLLPALFS